MSNSIKIKIPLGMNFGGFQSIPRSLCISAYRRLSLIFIGSFLIWTNSIYGQRQSVETKKNSLEFGIATGNFLDFSYYRPIGVNISYFRTNHKKWSFVARLDYYTTKTGTRWFETNNGGPEMLPYVINEDFGEADFSYANHTLPSQYSIDGNVYVSMGLRRNFRHDKKFSWALQLNFGTGLESSIEYATTLYIQIQDAEVNEYMRYVAFYRRNITPMVLVAVPMSYKITANTSILLQINYINSQWRDKYNTLSLGLSTSF